MLYLTSSVASVAEHLHNNYLREHNYSSILFIDTASEPEIGNKEGDDDWLIADFESLKAQGYNVDRYTITGKSAEDTRETLEKYDVIYMCGGNTAYLLDKLRSTGTFELITSWVKEGKPYIGTSAGSIIAGPRLPDYFYDDEMLDMTDRSCFNFVNFTLIPHWGSSHFRDEYLGRRLEIVYKDTQDPLLILTDSQYVVADDVGNYKIETI